MAVHQHAANVHRRAPPHTRWMFGMGACVWVGVCGVVGGGVCGGLGVCFGCRGRYRVVSALVAAVAWVCWAGLVGAFVQCSRVSWCCPPRRHYSCNTDKHLHIPAPGPHTRTRIHSPTPACTVPPSQQTPAHARFGRPSTNVHHNYGARCFRCAARLAAFDLMAHVHSELAMSSHGYGQRNLDLLYFAHHSSVPLFTPLTTVSRPHHPHQAVPAG